eukprot:TRINITY_DN2264_c0_g1_i1.p1 TRINITY_DN2264_c0_g1~~TRINITY_DN2264_c0_g1_i1.p1  ORF type:complete len:484 (+),score=89.46 TRINITY_DN2264_c0_g1_i1:73-1524(+)
MAGLTVPLAKSDDFDAWGGPANAANSGGFFGAMVCCRRRTRFEGGDQRKEAPHRAASHFHELTGRTSGMLNMAQAKTILVELNHCLPNSVIEDSFRDACRGRDTKLDYKGFMKFMGTIDNHILTKGETEFHTMDAGSSDESSSLILCTAVMFVVMYLGSAIVYGTWFREWTVISSVYFGVVTFTTVGYGDFGFINPDAPHSRSDIEKYIGGIFVFCGVAFIGAAAGTVLDALSKQAEMKAKASIKAAEVSAPNKWKADVDPQHSGMSEAEADFDVEKKICLLYGRLWKRELPVILFTTFSGALCMCQLEDDWNFADGFYWASITMTTVGYGDLHPTKEASKLFAIVYILLAFMVIASAVSFIASIPFEVRRLRHINEVLHQFGDSLDLHELRAIADGREIQQLRTPQQQSRVLETHGASVSRAEFVIWQLLKQEKIDFGEDIVKVLLTFDQLDADGSGRLTIADIEQSIQNQEQDEFAKHSAP